MPVTNLSLLDILTGAIWTMISVTLPILLTAMIIGLFIGILQTATSIQEQTLIFIPKILEVIKNEITVQGPINIIRLFCSILEQQDLYTEK